MSKKSKNKKEIIVNKKKFFYISLLWICILAIGLVKKTFQNDTFYSIKIGELIINNGIDMLDHFSIHNLSYTYPHWLFDVFIYITYLIGKYNGIYIATIILDLILLFVIYKCTFKITNSLSSPFIITLVCAIIMGQGFATARAQLVSYILFVLEIMFIELYIKEKKKRYIYGLLIISILICNIHVAVWPFYYVLFLPYIAESIICKIFKKIKSNNRFISYLRNKFMMEDEIPLLNLLLIMFISLFTGLITPLKDTPYTYLFKTMMGNSQKYIQEHQMASLKDSVFTIVIVIETLFLAIITKIKLRDLFLILGLSLMSIMSLRHIGLLTVGMSICFCRTYNNFTDLVGIDTDKIIYGFLRKKLVIIICFILAFTSLAFNLKTKMKDEYVDKDVYPVEGVKFLKENVNIDSMRIFNEYNFGSYLLLNDIPVFIDSRADLYTKEFSGLSYDIFDDYANMIKDYRRVFDFYNITHILIYNNTLLYTTIEKYENYNKLYEDKHFAIYERIVNEEE